MAADDLAAGTPSAVKRDALSHVVPDGFPALVRVLHPFSRTRPVNATWAEAMERRRQRDFDFSPEFVDETDVTWRAAAAAHGVELQPSSLSHEVLLRERHSHEEAASPDGWRYSTPEEGSLGADVLGHLAAVLRQHTATPEQGIAAIWEGWAGLVSAQGVGLMVLVELPPNIPRPLRPIVSFATRKWGEFQRYREMFGVRTALHAVATRRFPQPKGSGILPAQAAKGPRLELPDRAYVCFEAGVSEFVGEGWLTRAPWVESSRPSWVRSPNLLWPEGQEWVLVSEISLDSTLIACSRECADALLNLSGLEAVEITRDTPLWPPPVPPAPRAPAR